MSDLSLYRKYRPHNFQNLVGQDHVRTTLLNAAKRSNLSHAYLFCGPRGTGKTSTARLVAKVLNCTNIGKDFEPCNECDICEAISTGRLIDIIEIDAASNRGIDEMRELKDKIDFSPTSAKTKVYIIDEVHMLTKEAFNALLKTLEEPPEHAYFILATTEVHKIPETIISRCQRFDFKRITEKTIMTRLNYIAQLEKIEVEDGAIELIAHYVDGGMRDAIGLLEQLSADGVLKYEQVCKVLGMSDHEEIEKLYNLMVDGDTAAALREAQNIHSHGHDMAQFLKSFLEFVRVKMLAELNSGDSGSKSAWFLNLINTFQEASQQLRLTVIPQLPLEMAIIKFCSDLSGSVEAPKKSSMIKKLSSQKNVKHPTPELESKSVEENLEEQLEELTKEEPVHHEEQSGLKALPREEPSEDLIPSKAVESDKAESKSDANSDVVTTELSLESIKKHMPRVHEHVLQPSIKRSLISGQILKIEGSTLTFEFTTQFHQQKVLEHENRVQVEKAFKEVFGQDVKIEALLRKVDLVPALSKSEAGHSIDSSDDNASGDLAHQTKSKDQDLADIAADMFGGEFIED